MPRRCRDKKVKGWALTIVGCPLLFVFLASCTGVGREDSTPTERVEVLTVAPEVPRRLRSPHENVCFGEKASVIWGNGFDGKIENSMNIRDELSKRPWKDIYVFLSPRDYQWGTNEICVAIAELGRYLRERVKAEQIDIKRTPFVGVGDISLKNGRRFNQHIAHQTGLEADIFYIRKLSTQSELPLAHRWNRFNNRFPEQMVLKKHELSASFDLLENFRAFAFLQRELKLWITTDQVVIDGIKTLKDSVDSSDLNFFLEDSQHLEGHKDHFHMGLSCPISQVNCKNEWQEWHRLRRAGKRWKYEYN